MNMKEIHMGPIVMIENQEKRFNIAISGITMKAAISNLKMAVHANLLIAQLQNVILMVNATGKGVCLLTKSKILLF